MTRLILPLSTLPAILGNDGGPVRTTENASPGRKPRGRIIKCISAFWVKIDRNTNEPEKYWCLNPPIGGCP